MNKQLKFGVGLGSVLGVAIFLLFAIQLSDPESGLLFGLLVGGITAFVFGVTPMFLTHQTEKLAENESIAKKVNQSHSLLIYGSVEKVRQSLSHSARLLTKASVVQEEDDFVVIKTGTTWKTFGEKVVVSVQKVSEEQTRIDINSQPLNKATMVDYGKNYENVHVIADYFKATFSEAGMNNMTRWQGINVDELKFKAISAPIQFEHIDADTGEKLTLTTETVPSKPGVGIGILEYKVICQFHDVYLRKFRASSPYWYIFDHPEKVCGFSVFCITIGDMHIRVDCAYEMGESGASSKYPPKTNEGGRPIYYLNTIGEQELIFWHPVYQYEKKRHERKHYKDVDYVWQPPQGMQQGIVFAYATKFESREQQDKIVAIIKKAVKAYHFDDGRTIFNHQGEELEGDEFNSAYDLRKKDSDEFDRNYIVKSYFKNYGDAEVVITDELLKKLKSGDYINS